MFIKKAAVFGSGIMGKQIAAHLVNAGIPTLLYDLPAKEGDPNALIKKAIAELKKLKPAPLALPELAAYIFPANYENDLEQLKECDFIIEAVREDLSTKEALYKKVAPFIADHALIGSNTSGLSIQSLASALPESLQSRFCGIHFFNPPRYLPLVELTGHSKTNPQILDELETFLTTGLGKSVIRTKDTPNFVANRIGVFGILSMIHRAIEKNIPFEVVDQLTGKVFGRAKSALFRTLDVVGLDTLAYVIHTMTEQLPNDPWHDYYQVPAVIQDLISQAKLGQKTGSGFYYKNGKNIEIYDPNTKAYRAASGLADPEVLAILKISDPAERLQKLYASTAPQAQFLWLCLSDIFHYSAYHCASIAHNVRDLDLAMRWGFGWREGAFELWQLAGMKSIYDFISSDIQQQKSLVSAPLPKWIDELIHKDSAFYQVNAAFDPSSNTFVGRSNLPVYKRQLFFDAVIKEEFNWGETWYEDLAVRLWTLDQTVAILSFKSKNNTIGDDVLDGVLAAIKVAEAKAKAMVVWQFQGNDFSFGANLKQVMGEVYVKSGVPGVKLVIEKFQRASQALRYASIPVVAAVRGRALGGACEFIMHCDRAVAAMESYIGLVEVGVGLLPGGAGCKEFALRSYQQARGDNPYRDLVAYFKQIAMAEVSSSALDAKARNFLQSADIIVMHPHEILYVAILQAKALADFGYRPPNPPMIPVIGKAGIANLEMMLVNLLKGEFISEYDFEISLKVAKILCGGEIEAGSLVNEEWYLRLEREYFLELVAHPKTQARIKYTLENGKPLRN